MEDSKFKIHHHKCTDFAYVLTLLLNRERNELVKKHKLFRDAIRSPNYRDTACQFGSSIKYLYLRHQPEAGESCEKSCVANCGKGKSTTLTTLISMHKDKKAAPLKDAIAKRADGIPKRYAH